MNFSDRNLKYILVIYKRFMIEVKINDAAERVTSQRMDAE